MPSLYCSEGDLEEAKKAETEAAEADEDDEMEVAEQDQDDDGSDLTARLKKITQ